MHPIAIILSVFAVLGVVLGVFWRRGITGLIIAATSLGVALLVAFRGWSDLDLPAVIRSWSAIVSWSVHLAVEAVWAVLPVLLGALAGRYVRMRCCSHGAA
jgi:hypothetical protein